MPILFAGTKDSIGEIDGATHSTDEERRRDARRADLLAEGGYRIARFVNHEVHGNIEGVLETILAALERRSTL